MPADDTGPHVVKSRPMTFVYSNHSTPKQYVWLLLSFARLRNESSTILDGYPCGLGCVGGGIDCTAPPDCNHFLKMHAALPLLSYLKLFLNSDLGDKYNLRVVMVI